MQGVMLTHRARIRPLAALSKCKNMEIIYLAPTPRGLQKTLQSAAETGATVWCGSDTMSEEDFDAFVGIDVSRFNYSLGDASADVLEGAIHTIREHHPDSTIWVEARV